MIPPTKNELQAYAGWSLVARNQCSDHQHLALCHFGEAAGELSEVIEELPVVHPAPRAAQLASPAPDRPLEIPTAERLEIGVRSDGPCRHNKFDIHTQRCLECGITYRQALGRKPELM